jgi:hypothetical protein
MASEARCNQFFRAAIGLLPPAASDILRREGRRRRQEGRPGISGRERRDEPQQPIPQNLVDQPSTQQKEPRMRIAKQLAVFLENKPGTLAGVCRELSKRGINIIALSVSDTVDHAVVRMVVSDPMRAGFLLGEHGVLVVESDVVLAEITNRPGALASIAETLAEHKVNIEYAYASAVPTAKKGMCVLRVSDAPKAVRALRGKAK